MPALRREWLGARLVAAFGVLIVGAVVATILVNNWSERQPNMEAVAPAPPSNADARRAENIAVCTAALVSAQTLGVMPAFAVRDGDEAKTTSVQGRYACGARTDAARYTIVFDLVCTDLTRSDCVVPFQIAQQGGGVIFQRP